VPPLVIVTFIAVAAGIVVPVIATTAVVFPVPPGAAIVTV